MRQDKKIEFVIESYNLAGLLYRRENDEVGFCAPNTRRIILYVNRESTVKDIIYEIDRQVLYYNNVGLYRLASFRQHFSYNHNIDYKYNELFDEYNNKTEKLSRKMCKLYEIDSYTNSKNLFRNIPFLYKISGEQYTLFKSIQLADGKTINIKEVKELFDTYLVFHNYIINVVSLKITKRRKIKITIEIIISEDYYLTIGCFITNLRFIEKTGNYSEFKNLAKKLNIYCDDMDDKEIYNAVKSRILELKWSDFVIR